MSGILAVYLGMTFAFAWLLATAPEGYEDDAGFHYGKPSDDLSSDNADGLGAGTANFHTTGVDQ
jgi:hypothetical protein